MLFASGGAAKPACASSSPYGEKNNMVNELRCSTGYIL